MEQCIAKLKACPAPSGTKHALHEHGPVMNVEEMLKNDVLSKLAETSCITKNLLLKDKKKKLYLLCVHHKTAIDMKKAVKLVGAANSFRFAGAEDLAKTLNVEQGHVSPLAAINDADHKVKIVLDKSMEGKSVLVHPCTNKASVSVAFDDLRAFLEGIGCEVVVTDFAGEPAAAPAGGKPAGKAGKKEKKGKKDNKQKQKPKPQPKKKDKGGKGNNEDGLTVTKEGNFASWYKQIVEKSEMIEYYCISGCYILRPWSFQIWDVIHKFLDEGIQKLGVKNSYFPLFVSEEALIKEANHIEDFAP